ncbi:MAG: competence protein ComJ [Anaerolineae bacterium]
MKSESFDLSVLYSTLAVFDPSLEQPFNDWSDQHVAQGFSWRPGSVSFATLQEGGSHRIEVELAEQFSLQDNTKRAIVVPFSINAASLVEVASIPSSRLIQFPEGDYELYYEAGQDEVGPWCRLTFVPGSNREARILRADEELSPSYPLTMQADPA